MSTRRDDDIAPVDPEDYVGIVGRTFTKHERAPVLAIGKMQWSRWTLARLGLLHPVAAATLNRVIRQLEITTLPQLAARAQEIGSFKGCGVTTYWTVLAILKSAGYDILDVHHTDVTYNTVKQRAIRAEQRDTPQRRKRRKKG